MSVVAAFFDLDGTLTTGHLYSNVVRQRMRDPKGAVRAVWYLTSHLVMVIPYKLGLLDKPRFFISWIKDLAPLFKGVRCFEALPEFRAVAEELLSAVRQDVLQLLQEHQSEGHLTVLVSGTFLPVLQDVARHLNVDHIVGTPLEEKDGRYTGRLVGPMCFADEKAGQLKASLERNGLDVDLQASYAYADRYHDISLLEMVGHPVAVYPDEVLLAHAREEGWQVVGGASA